MSEEIIHEYRIGVFCDMYVAMGEKNPVGDINDILKDCGCAERLKVENPPLVTMKLSLNQSDKPTEEQLAEALGYIREKFVETMAVDGLRLDKAVSIRVLGYNKRKRIRKENADE